MIQEQQSGFTFPLTRSKGQPLRYVNNDTVTLLKASVRQILLTSPGERMWLPDFGSRLRELHFEPISNTMESIVTSVVLEAIAKWETRIVVTASDITILQEDGGIRIGIVFRVKNPDFASTEISSVLVEL